VIYAVTGAPGSGKSFYTVRKIAESLARGKCVATNATLLPGWSERLAKSNPITRLRPGGVVSRGADYQDRLHYTNDLAELFSIKLAGKGEGRGVAVLDESHEWLNNRTWKDDDRQEINAWFAEHRKRGWDVYLITQHLDSIDKQVRDRIEFHIRLRNLRNLKVAGVPLLPVPMFMAIHVWASGPRTQPHIAKREVFRLDWRRKLYDSFALVHDGYDVADDHALWLPRSAGPPARAPQAAAGELSA
jgi:adenosyl cobinamide kinase/adenosyl cobinamide phosphate guanylyltransferase